MLVVGCLIADFYDLCYEPVTILDYLLLELNKLCRTGDGQWDKHKTLEASIIKIFETNDPAGVKVTKSAAKSYMKQISFAYCIWDTYVLLLLLILYC